MGGSDAAADCVRSVDLFAAIVSFRHFKPDVDIHPVSTSLYQADSL